MARSIFNSVTKRCIVKAMRRMFLGMLSTLLLSGSFGGFVYAQNVNNFVISQFEADYYLSQDSDGRSQLKTVEKITAEFPNYDQNHGLERAIPKSYDGHSTSLKIESITDEKGQNLSYSDYTSNDNLVLRIGNPDSYVHGPQTYIITYTQRDVTRYFANTNDDEFYWDINGVFWRVPIETTVARVHVTPPLSDSLNSQASCYQGQSGATAQCSLTQEPESGGGMLFTAEVSGLGNSATMTLAIGFRAHTFTDYQPTLLERLVQLWVALLVISAAMAIGLLIWLSMRYRRIMRRAAGRATIIPEYLPPKDTSVLAAAQILRNSTADITAQLIDLAVRHYLKIYQTKEKTLFSQPEYELEIVKNLGSLLKEERELLEDLFGANPKPGDKFAMKELQKSYALRKKLLERRKYVRKSSRSEYGLFERAAGEARWFNRVGAVLLIISLVILSPFILAVAIVAFALAHSLWPLTQKGAELRDYLEGLKLYIGVAEKERLKMLQGPEGAEKVGRIDENNPRQLVKLYERVLPYAVLFGEEKEWVKHLGAYYETSDTQPDWYVGYGVFNAAVFSSAVSGFAAASSSYSSSSSASTGGAGGGGSAGGGGGGGGGGGW